MGKVAGKKVGQGLVLRCFGCGVEVFGSSDLRGMGKLSEVLVSNEVIYAVSATCVSMEQAMDDAVNSLDARIKQEVERLNRHYFSVQARKVSISHAVATSSVLSNLRYQVSISCLVDFFYPETSQ